MLIALLKQKLNWLELKTDSLWRILVMDVAAICLTVAMLATVGAAMYWTLLGFIAWVAFTCIAAVFAGICYLCEDHPSEEIEGQPFYLPDDWDEGILVREEGTPVFAELVFEA